MLIGLIGDIHGRVLHMLAAVATWQKKISRPFDLLIQVGDLGAFPDIAKLDPATNRYLAADPAEADFSRLLNVAGPQAAAVTALRNQFAGPIFFIRGNHEDFDWLYQLPVNQQSKTAAADPFDLFHYVPDGTVLEFNDEFNGLKVAFLGGVEERTDQAGLNQVAYQSLLSLGPGTIDLLVTHQGPYGSSIGYHGDTHGSKLITQLIETLQPKFQVAGHAHTVSGPQIYARTLYLGLDCIVASPIWEPDARGLQPGCLAVLDTEAGHLEPVTDPWLADFDTPPFDFEAWFRGFMA